MKSLNMLEKGMAAWKVMRMCPLMLCSISVCCVTLSGVSSACLCAVRHREALQLRPATVCRQLGVINTALSVRSHMQQLVPLWAFFNRAGARVAVTRAFVRKKRGDSSSAAAELLSASVTFHAERVCWEDRRASLRPPPSVSVGTAPPKQGGKCRNIISVPFFHRNLLENQWSDQKLGSFAIFAVRSHYETEEGRKACREYRWEQLLTNPSQRSAARLDKAEGTLVWGSWQSSVFYSGLLITIAQFLCLIFLSPVWGWRLCRRVSS